MIYEYVCYDCNRLVSKSYGVDEEHLHPVCPKCKQKMSRLFTTQIHFIGGGWPSKSIKIAKEVEEVEKIQNEGWQCENEMKEGMDMEKEHIAKRKKEGRLPSATLPGEETAKTAEDLVKARNAQAKLIGA